MIIILFLSFILCYFVLNGVSKMLFCSKHGLSLDLLTCNELQNHIKNKAGLK